MFTARQYALRWSRFKELAPEQMFETVRDRVFPFIKSLGQTRDSAEGSTYTHHMKDAFFMMPTARVLANVVDQLDDIDMADSDTKGDLYEYMLGKIFQRPAAKPWSCPARTPTAVPAHRRPSPIQ